ncbi:MAG: S8 family peptidase [bacterium]
MTLTPRTHHVKPVHGLSFLAIALYACAPASSITPAAPAPSPIVAQAPAAQAPIASPPAAPAKKAPLTESPRNWQLLDENADGVPGISSERAMHDLLAGVQPKRTVIVAVIDGGTDTAHADLRANLWTNPREVAHNGADDDKNGYVDDVHGWNFIGGKDGRDVNQDTHEVTRQYVRCKSATPPYPADKCAAITADFEKERGEAVQTLAQVHQIDSVFTAITKVLSTALGTDSLAPERLAAFQPSDPTLARAKSIYMQLHAQGLNRHEIDEGLKAYGSRVKYGLNPAFDSRTVVGDNYANVAERTYGNADVTGPDASHGTHVAGIIGAVRGNGVGIDGIAPAVKLMIVRTVPDGDERDKDVANAIRYATDNGAQVINMSFGKGYSPDKSAVDDAVKYADAHGVLMVHAAGNDGADLADKANFPTPVYANGDHARNWIEVGASSWKGGDSLAASFSNYSHTLVDVFAPGVDILSTVPGGLYEKDSGTSMASPVVTGLAALLMAYYPSLTAADVKKIIVSSAVSHASQMVVKPGGADKVPFGTLSISGGVVNAYDAIKMAQQMTATRP